MGIITSAFDAPGSTVGHETLTLTPSDLNPCSKNCEEDIALGTLFVAAIYDMSDTEGCLSLCTITHHGCQYG